MTVEQVSLLDSSDIKGILLTCPRCAVSVRILKDSTIPGGCSSCNSAFSVGSKHAVAAIQRFIAEASHEAVNEKVQIWV